MIASRGRLYVAVAISAALHGYTLLYAFRDVHDGTIEHYSESWKLQPALTVTLAHLQPVELHQPEAPLPEVTAPAEVKGWVGTNAKKISEVSMGPARVQESKPDAVREAPALPLPAESVLSKEAPRSVEVPAEPNYLKSSELDPPPRPLQDIVPEYPDLAGIQEGYVVLEVMINEEGTVDRVNILQSFPVGLFDDAAREAFARARFSPGKLLGVPVKSKLTIRVRFTPMNRGGRVSGRGY